MPNPSLPEEGPFSVHIHYHRPPDRTELFIQELVHDDGRTKITLARRMTLPAPLRIDDEIALEDGSDAVWFTFPGAWHDIGRFHRADGTLTGIYANVLVPCVFEPGGTWRTTDLFLDVWIPTPEGRWLDGPSPGARLLDEEELKSARKHGWISGETARRAREEGRRIVEAAHRGSWPPPVVTEWTRERALGGSRAAL